MNQCGTYGTAVKGNKSMINKFSGDFQPIFTSGLNLIGQKIINVFIFGGSNVLAALVHFLIFLVIILSGDPAAQYTSFYGRA